MAFRFDAIGFPLLENGSPPRLRQIAARNLRPPSLSLNFPACAAPTPDALPGGPGRELQFHRPRIARTNPVLAARPTCV
jgi:hypothetical protein